MKYQDYLKTEHWKKVRKNKYKNKKRTCCICNSNIKLNVHHLNYDCIWKEEGNDLRILCESCHKLAHKLIPYIKRKDGVSYYYLSNAGRYALLKNKIKKYLGISGKNMFFKNINQSSLF